MNIANYEEVFILLHKELDKLKDLNHTKIQEVFNSINSELNSIENAANELKTSNSVLRIGVVGQVKAGKSSFLNSLFFNGENVLPRASTPMTAGLTVLKYGESNSFSVEYYNSAEWDVFQGLAKQYKEIIQEYKASNPNLTDKEIEEAANIDSAICSAYSLVKSCSHKAQSKIQDKALIEEISFNSLSDLQDVLSTYVGADGEYTSIVKCLTIELNDKRLQDLQIVDTPGVNDPVVSREHRTREFLRSCHGVFFLSMASRFFDSTDVSFLSERIGSEGIGTIVLLASKYDSVLQDVGTKYHDDLNAAFNNCNYNLRAQFKRNLAQSSYRGDDPIFDTNSGIGFSIAQKNKSDWDTMEAHVVKQMQKFYPSYFSSDEEIKQIFLEMSNINDIKEKYLDKVFLSNKDKIISNKMNGYFSNATEKFKKAVDDKTNMLSNYISDLGSKNIEEIRSMIESQEEAIKNISASLHTISNKASKDTDRYIKEILSDCIFSWDRNIPTKSEERTITRASTILGIGKHFDFSYKIVDPQKLINTIEKAYNNYLKQIKDEWNKKNNGLRDNILEKFSAIISDSEANNKNFKGDYFRHIIEDIWVNIQNATELATDNIRQSLVNALESALTDSVYRPGSFGSMSEAETKNKVTDESQKKIQKCISSISDVMSTIHEELIKLLRDSSKDVTSVVIENRDTFISGIKKSTEEYTNSLKSDLKEKEKNLKLMNEAKNILINLKKQI